MSREAADDGPLVPPTRVGSDLLSAALAAALSAWFGEPTHVARLDRAISDYSTSFTIEELNVLTDSQKSLRLTLKDLSWQSLLPESRDVRPRFLYDPMREIEIYRKLLPQLDLGTAECYGAIIDESADLYGLFLEFIDGPQLSHVGEFEHWQATAAWLARLHRESRQFLQSRQPTIPLLHYDHGWYQKWFERAKPRLLQAGAENADSGRRIRRLLDNYPTIAKRLASLPPTIIHGEFYSSNVLLQEGASGVRVCPVDWESSAIAPGAMDLSSLTAGGWSQEQRRAMIESYRTAADDRRPLEALMDEVADCRIHQSIQWLGWATNWTAPPEQKNDWLGDLLETAERRGLC